MWKTKDFVKERVDVQYNTVSRILNNQMDISGAYVRLLMQGVLSKRLRLSVPGIATSSSTPITSKKLVLEHTWQLLQY
jgi:hypothetical protein